MRKEKHAELSIRDSSSEVVTVTNISGTSHTLSATNGNLLQVDGRNYFWKVTAKDDAGNESVDP